MNRKLFVVLSVFVLVSMVLAACGPGGSAQSKAIEIEGLEEVDFAPVKYEAPNCDYGGEFKSIEAVDETTVKITLCVPDPAFPSKIAFTAFAVQPKEYLQSTGATGDILSQPIGTGPYYVAQWEKGNQLVLACSCLRSALHWRTAYHRQRPPQPGGWQTRLQCRVRRGRRDQA